MRRTYLLLWASAFLFSFVPGRTVCAQGPAQNARNPIIWADVPDPSVIRVDSVYYMASTTMHMSPGVPIMKSRNLVDWEMIGYAYNELADADGLALRRGQDAYGRGSWASSIRYHDGTFYIATFSYTTGETYVFTTEDIENGSWRRASLNGLYHDQSLFFDDDGRVYLVYGAGDIRIIELTEDARAVKPGGVDRVLTPNAGRIAGTSFFVPGEGSHMEKVDGRGAVGRIPYLVPMVWEDGWPVLGIDGTVPDTLDIPTRWTGVSGIVASDEFDDELGLVWRWNHNPVDAYGSLTERPGYLRLTTDRRDASMVDTRNTLTQRTFGPESTALDVRNMNDGDVAGLGLLAEHYGFVGVKKEDGATSIVMVNAGGGEVERVRLDQDVVYLRADADFQKQTDRAGFSFSLDGETWTRIGDTLQMRYTLGHFMGYRFALFTYATETPGGSVDFDYFRLGSLGRPGR